MRQVVAYKRLKKDGKSLTVRPKKWSRSLTGDGRLLDVSTVRLWPGKFWCFRLAVAYGRWSLTRGGHTGRFNCRLEFSRCRLKRSRMYVVSVWAMLRHIDIKEEQNKHLLESMQHVLAHFQLTKLGCCWSVQFKESWQYRAKYLKYRKPKTTYKMKKYKTRTMTLAVIKILVK